MSKNPLQANQERLEEYYNFNVECGVRGLRG